MMGSVLGALRGRRSGLQPAMKRVADALLEDPAACAALTITELSTRCGVAQSTVMRLCRALGMDGYRELRMRLSSEIAVNDARSITQTLHGDISPDDDLQSVVHKIVQADIQAVEDTMAGMSMRSLAQVVDLILDAESVVLFGVGASGLVAKDFESKLTRIGKNARAITDSHEVLMAAALLTPSDVVIAISHSGATTEVLDALDVSSAAGSTSVGITNGAGSPLATTVDHCLLTAAHESTFRSGATASRFAQLTVVDCLFVAVAQRSYSESQTALELTFAAVQSRRRRR